MKRGTEPDHLEGGGVAGAGNTWSAIKNWVRVLEHGQNMDNRSGLGKINALFGPNRTVPER